MIHYLYNIRNYYEIEAFKGLKIYRRYKSKMRRA